MTTTGGRRSALTGGVLNGAQENRMLVSVGVWLWYVAVLPEWIKAGFPLHFFKDSFKAYEKDVNIY